MVASKMVLDKKRTVRLIKLKPEQGQENHLVSRDGHNSRGWRQTV